MKRLAPALAAFTLLTLGASAALAHHGLTQEFDVKKLVTLKGVVSKVDWVNPHIYFVLDVDQGGGKTQKYLVETVPVAFARKAGVTKEIMMGGGKPIELAAFPGRTDQSRVFAKIITFSDGRTLQLSGDR